MTPDTRMVPRRRVLVCNHHIDVRAGSELVTLEVAETLHSRGHAVAVFTFHVGELATEFSARTGISVFGLGNGTEISSFDPDVIHAHHWPTLALLRRLGVTAPVVMGFLGSLPDLENPPPIRVESQIPWWAVSEETHANVSAVPGWDQGRSAVIRNWFDDRTGLPARRQAPVEMGRILIVSNHFPEQLRELLRFAASEAGGTVTHVGLPDNPAVVDRELLVSFDAVVTLGRTAVECLALGVPVLVLDAHGGDGWVTPDNVQTLATHNFSGRALRLEPTPERLARWFTSAPGPGSLQQLQEWAWREASLQRAVDRLESLYEFALSHPAGNLGRWSNVVADYAADRHHLASVVDNLARQLSAVTAELSAVTAQTNSQAVVLRRCEEELAVVTRERASLAAERADLLASVSWRVTAPLRAAKRAAAPIRRARHGPPTDARSPDADLA